MLGDLDRALWENWVRSGPIGRNAGARQKNRGPSVSFLSASASLRYANLREQCNETQRSFTALRKAQEHRRHVMEEGDGPL